MKSPPEQYTDDVARRMVENFIAPPTIEELVETVELVAEKVAE